MLIKSCWRGPCISLYKLLIDFFFSHSRVYHSLFRNFYGVVCNVRYLGIVICSNLIRLWSYNYLLGKVKLGFSQLLDELLIKIILWARLGKIKLANLNSIKEYYVLILSTYLVDSRSGFEFFLSLFWLLH